MMRDSKLVHYESVSENSFRRFISGGLEVSRTHEVLDTSMRWDILSKVSFNISANSKAIVSIFKVKDLRKFENARPSETLLQTPQF